MGKGKKKGVKKGGGKNKKEKPVPTISPEELRLQYLRTTCYELECDVEKETRAYNEFQEQREKLGYFWIVEKKNREDKKAELRNKERELQDLDEQHQVTIKVYKQRVKHLLHEHQNQTAKLKAEGEQSVKIKEDGHRISERELKQDKRSYHLELKEKELSHNNLLKSLKGLQDREITSLRNEFERKTKEMHSKYERRMNIVRNDLDTNRKTDLQKIEDRKNIQISDLMKTHEKAFADIKNYYNDITHNNLDLIKSLKEEVGKLKKDELRQEKVMFEIAQENKRMSEPLEKARADVERLTKELSSYEKDKERLKNTKLQLLIVEEQLKGLMWEHEVLTQREKRVEMERDKLYKKFHGAVFDVQQKSGFKNMLLKKKLSALESGLEKTEAQLNEVLVQAKLDSSVVGSVSSKLDDVIEAKNQTVRDLQAELDRVVLAHKNVVSTYETKLQEYSIPFEELGFKPCVGVF